MNYRKPMKYMMLAAMLALSGCTAIHAGETFPASEDQTESTFEVSSEIKTEASEVSLEESDNTGTQTQETQSQETQPQETQPQETQTQETQPQETEASTPQTEPETTTEPATEIAIEAAVTGSFYLGDTLNAGNFSIKVTMSDGSVLTNPPGWAAAPLTLNSTENSITVFYGNVSTVITVSAQERPVETSTEAETIKPAGTTTYTDPALLAGPTLNGLSVVGTAMKWLGTVYSQDPNAGIDCSRLVKAVLADIGVSRTDTMGDVNYNYLPGYTGQWRDVSNSTCFYYNGLELHFPVSYYTDINAINSQLLSAPGNIILYEPASGLSNEWHMSFTIGQFANREEVISWLSSVYGGQGFDEAYFAAHPELVYDYGNGYTYWRIHSGQDANYVRIDNGTEGHHHACGWFLFQSNQ